MAATQENVSIDGGRAPEQREDLAPSEGGKSAASERSEENHDQGSMVPVIFVIIAQFTPLLILSYLEFQSHQHQRAVLTPPYQEGTPMYRMVETAPTILGCAFLIMTLLWSFDYNEWRGSFWFIGSCTFIIPAAVGTILFALNKFMPDAALSIILMLGLLACAAVRALSDILPISHQRLLWWMQCTSGTVGFLFGLLTVYSAHTKIDFNESPEAELNNLNAIVTPMVGAVFNIVLMLLVHTQLHSAQNQSDDTKLMVYKVELAIVGIAVSMMLYWAALSMATVDGSAIDIAGFFRRQATIIGVLVVAFILRIRGQLIRAAEKREALPKWALHISESDWLRAVWVIVALPVLPLFKVFNAFRGMCRYCTGLGKKSSKIEYDSWDTTSVISKATLLCVGYLLLVVLMRDAMNLFMTWLREATAPLGTATLTITLYITGVLLFCLPPTTGVPIYVLAGCLLPERFATDTANPSMQDSGVRLGILVASLMSLVMKLSGCVVQQAFIGAFFGKMQGVRKLCGVHTVPIRATEGILKGNLAFPKICILLGCPDWPTSVLCGILELPLLSTLFLTLPVYFQSALPTVLSGTFIWLSESAKETADIKAYQLYGGIALAAVGFFQFALLMLSVNYIRKEASVNSEKYHIHRPEDEVLIEAVARDVQTEHKARQMLKWSRLPGPIKILHILAFLSFWVAAFLSQLYAASKLPREGGKQSAGRRLLIATEKATSFFGSEAQQLDPEKLHGTFLTVLGVACIPYFMVKTYERVTLRFLKDDGSQDEDAEPNEKTPLTANTA